MFDSEITYENYGSELPSVKNNIKSCDSKTFFPELDTQYTIKRC